MAKKPKKFFKKKHAPEEKTQTKGVSKKKNQEKVEVKREQKETQKKKEFPKIPRFIPELPRISLGKPHFPSLSAYSKRLKKYGTTKLIFAGVLLFFALLLCVFAVMSFYHVYTAWSQEMTKRQQLYAQMQLWANITKTYPTYRDAYFKGALIAYQLGDSQKLHYFLDKLHLLDPNFPLAAPLEKLDTVQQLGGK